MYTVSKEISFCYGHRLLDHDGVCRHLHGHNGRAEIVLRAASLDEQGMVADFSEVKHTVKTWIDETFDHAMLLREDDPLLPLLSEHDERVRGLPCNPTAENIARLIFEFVQEAGFPVVEVRLWETQTAVAAYCPSQGDETG